jgi:Protein of unknown function (DUF3999)
MKRLLSGLVLSGITYAALQTDQWAFRRQVKTSQAAFDVLALDAIVYQASKAQLNDLRLLRSGTEVPYVLRTLSGGRELKRFSPRITDRIAIPGVGTQAVLEIRESAAHNRLTIETDQTNFRQRVRVEGSNDGKHWGMIRRDGTIFDVSTSDQHASNLSVSYPDSTQRYLRITVEGWRNPHAIRSVSMSFVRNLPAQREVVAEVAPNVTSDRTTRASVLEIDLGFDRPFDCIRFEPATGFFSRSVTVSASRDKKKWEIAGFGTIERSAGGEQLSVYVPEHWARYVRGEVRNEDNPPLVFSRVRVQALRRQLIFPADASGSYWLYSGNPKAEPVQYDLGTILPPQVNALPALFGPLEKNPGYKPPKPPVSERSPWLLPGLLALLVPVLGIIAFRMLQQVNSSR